MGKVKLSVVLSSLETKVANQLVTRQQLSAFRNVDVVRTTRQTWGSKGIQHNVLVRISLHIADQLGF